MVVPFGVFVASDIGVLFQNYLSDLVVTFFSESFNLASLFSFL